MLKIGKLKLKSNLILSPMAGISDYPFRMLCRKFGCELAFVEMINCRSVSHKSRKTAQMLFSSGQDRPLGVQLLGCEVSFIQKGLAALKEYNFDILDFNAACPAKKVTRRGEGASLLKSPKKINEILKIIVKALKVPVTIKIRSGWDADSFNADETSRAAEDAGVDAIFIHGRTKQQGYGGRVDYSQIIKVKKAVKIPVIASGDIFSALLAKKMIEETGCDGLAVARGSLGNPWIFREISAYLNTGSLVEAPSREEIICVMAEHLNMCADYYGQNNGVIIFRKFFSWYTKGFRKIRPLREKSSRIKLKADMLEIIEKCRGNDYA